MSIIITDIMIQIYFTEPIDPVNPTEPVDEVNPLVLIDLVNLTESNGEWYHNHISSSVETFLLCL